MYRVFRGMHRDFCPGQGVKLCDQGGLIILLREHVVRAEFLDEVAGVSTLSVQRIGGHHDPSHVHGAQKWWETGDLVGLSVYLSLSHRDSTVMGHRRQQVHAALPGVITGATQRLAVHRDRPIAIVLASQPGTDRAIERITIDPSEHASQGGFARGLGRYRVAGPSVLHGWPAGVAGDPRPNSPIAV